MVAGSGLVAAGVASSAEVAEVANTAVEVGVPAGAANTAVGVGVPARAANTAVGVAVPSGAAGEVGATGEAAAGRRDRAG